MLVSVYSVLYGMIDCETRTKRYTYFDKAVKKNVRHCYATQRQVAIIFDNLYLIMFGREKFHVAPRSVSDFKETRNSETE